MPGLAGAVRRGESLDLHRSAVETGAGCLRGRVSNRVGQIALLAKNLREYMIEPFDQLGLGAKVLPERIEMMRAIADAIFARLLVNGDIGLAEGVDRLHGIADAEGGAWLVGLPGGEQPGE